MYQREALWMSFYFSHLSGDGPRAIKVSVGGTNAITGLAKNCTTNVPVQDYLAERQPFLDGVAYEPGVIRQFTAVNIDESYTIEEQLSGKVSSYFYASGLQLKTDNVIS